MGSEKSEYGSVNQYKEEVSIYHEVNLLPEDITNFDFLKKNDKSKSISEVKVINFRGEESSHKEDKCNTQITKCTRLDDEEFTEDELSKSKLKLITPSKRNSRNQDMLIENHENIDKKAGGCCVGRGKCIIF